VQTFYSFSFILSIFATIATVFMVACPGEEAEKGLVKFAFIDLAISGKIL